MLVHRLALSFALCSLACTAHEDTTTPAPAARIEVKVASVQMVQDCSDPPGDAAAESAAATELADRKAAAPLTPAQAPAAGAPMPADESREMAAGTSRRMAPGSNWSPPCTQSTVQLSIANTGDREGKVRIDAVRVLDARSNKEVGKIQARKPSQWNPAGTYQPWNETVVHGTTVKVGYRIGEPDWSTVGVDTDPYARPYVLELDVSVDGVSQTVRSPEFVREPIHVIVT